MNIVQSTRAYERWLRKQLNGDIVAGDLRTKHERMDEGPFPFLRATYWRWAETILDVCPELADAPAVLAVGDVHLENFGTWRDADGRLVWGVNDFDEAAEMPYVVDLVRLAVSAVLARGAHRISVGALCDDICDGYREGLRDPNPFVLDGQYRWLRNRATVPDDARAKFWKKMDKAKAKPKTPPRAYAQSLTTALPAKIPLTFFPRSAGTGSLGRPRWIGYGEWRGAPIVREAKAMVSSGWVRAHPPVRSKLHCVEIARGRYHSPDPWYDLVGNVLVRRLSPNNRKIEVEENLFTLFDRRMLRAMGRELANVHLGSHDRRKTIGADLRQRKGVAFRACVETAAEFVEREHKEWRARRQ